MNDLKRAAMAMRDMLSKLEVMEDFDQDTVYFRLPRSEYQNYKAAIIALDDVLEPHVD